MESVKLLKVLANQNRYTILCLLRGTNGLNVNAIVNSLELPQNLTSHHLAILRNNGFVSVESRGTHRIYKLNRRNIGEVLSAVRKEIY